MGTSEWWTTESVFWTDSLKLIKLMGNTLFLLKFMVLKHLWVWWELLNLSNDVILRELICQIKGASHHCNHNVA